GISRKLRGHQLSGQGPLTEKRRSHTLENTPRLATGAPPRLEPWPSGRGLHFSWSSPGCNDGHGNSNGARRLGKTRAPTGSGRRGSLLLTGTDNQTSYSD